MSTLVEAVASLAKQEGVNGTPLEGVAVFKSSSSSERVPLCYSQGIVFVVQGCKRIHLYQQTYEYDSENYLVLTLPLPAECDTVVEPGKPMLALAVDFDMTMLSDLIQLFDRHDRLDFSDSLADSKGLFVSPCSEAIQDVLTRLSCCLVSPLYSEALGPGLLRELMFHIMTGPQAAPLLALVSRNTHLSRIDRVLRHLHKNFHERLDVDELASMANMSSSTFHRNFRKMTSSSPIQYVKKIRLSRARELLLDQGMKVKQAASQVGYESPTQFSREFKRYFGHSPQQSSRVFPA